jgi:hypothetical protein
LRAKRAAHARIAKRCRVTEAMVELGVMNALNGSASKRISGERYAKRFYAALIMCDMMAERPIEVVARTYGVERGVIANLMDFGMPAAVHTTLFGISSHLISCRAIHQSASQFSKKMAIFCQTLGLDLMEALFPAMGHRLNFGVRRDLVELVQIKGIKQARARYTCSTFKNNMVACTDMYGARCCVECLLKPVTPTRSRLPMLTYAIVHSSP